MEQELAERIYIQRKYLGYTQQELADAAGVTRQSVNALENGHALNMRWSTIEKILIACGVRLRFDGFETLPILSAHEEERGNREDGRFGTVSEEDDDDAVLIAKHLKENYWIELP